MTGHRAACGADFPLAKRPELAVVTHELTCMRCAGTPKYLARQAAAAIDSGRYEGVEISCFNRSEVDEIMALLPERIRDRVNFKWLVFPADGTASTGESNQ